MDQLERKVLEIVEQARATEMKQDARRMEDRFDRSRRVKVWTYIGWTIHDCFTSLPASICGLTDESGVALELLGDTDYGGCDRGYQRHGGKMMFVEVSGMEDSAGEIEVVSKPPLGKCSTNIISCLLVQAHDGWLGAPCPAARRREVVPSHSPGSLTP
jgi:hypothetical protein